jgi:signal peptidase I
MRDGSLIINRVAAPLEPLEPLELRPPDCAAGLYPRYRETLPGGSRHPILDECGPGALRDMAELVVPSGHYFMLGDNRDDSADSRDPVAGVGLVPQEALVARALVIAYSRAGWARIGSSLE